MKIIISAHEVVEQSWITAPLFYQFWHEVQIFFTENIFCVPVLDILLHNIFAYCLI